VEWRDGGLWLVETDPDAPDHQLDSTPDPLCFVMRGGRPSGEPLVFLRGPDGRIDRANMGGYPLSGWRRHQGEPGRADRGDVAIASDGGVRLRD